MRDREFRILLIEDNQPDVYLVRSALEEAGLVFRLDVCSDGGEGLERVMDINRSAGSRPDLLLLDLNLPKHGGYHILDQLRSGAEGEHVPVIVLSSSDSPNDRAQAASLGVRHFFRKPPDLDEFLELGGIVRALLAGA